MRRSRKKKFNNRNSLSLESIDVRELLGDLNIYYTESGKNVSEGWIGVQCAFCDDQSNHMGIHTESKVISCFKCGKTGTIVSYLSAVLNSTQKALSVVKGSIPRELKSFKTGSKTHALRVELPKEATQEPSKYHKAYLKSRRFSAKRLIDRYNLYFCPPYGKWANRIIVPVIKNYRLITFTSVDISTETRLRYRHEKDERSVIPIKHYLFGLDWTDGHSVIITEGLFDMLRIGDGAVCTFGVIPTAEQKRLLSKFDIVKIAFDGDKYGRNGAEKLANDLAAFSDVRIFDLPEGSDPDKLSKSDIKILKES